MILRKRFGLFSHLSRLRGSSASPDLLIAAGAKSCWQVPNRATHENTTRPFSHSHWLPVSFSIDYKILKLRNSHPLHIWAIQDSELTFNSLDLKPGILCLYAFIFFLLTLVFISLLMFSCGHFLQHICETSTFFYAVINKLMVYLNSVCYNIIVCLNCKIVAPCF